MAPKKAVKKKAAQPSAAARKSSRKAVKKQTSKKAPALSKKAAAKPTKVTMAQKVRTATARPKETKEKTAVATSTAAPKERVSKPRTSSSRGVRASPPPPPSPSVSDLILQIVQGKGRLSTLLLARAKEEQALYSASAPSDTSRTRSRHKPGNPVSYADSKPIQPPSADAQVVCTNALAVVSHTLTLLCCRILQHLTTRTSKAFLKVATRGHTPPSSDSDEAEVPEDDVLDRRNAPRGGRADQRVDAAQELVYRTVRSTIAAACTLGHRSCQAIWGPRGCGKHRLLRLIAADCAHQRGTFVLELHGDLLRSDVAALRVVAEQMYAFLRAPQSASLRAADPMIASGQFDFGVLFQFPRRLAAEVPSDQDAHQSRADRTQREDSEAAPATASALWQGERGMSERGNSHQAGEDDEEEYEEEDEDEDEDEASMLISSTTAYLAGGAASALSALQRALLLFKSHGVNIVICLRHADQFGICCDQLFYVLSGLMHEGDEHGGGLSLVLSSSAPDIQQLEKRLSSRLTCETQYIPLLPWTARRLVRASVTLLSDYCRCQLAQLLLADRRLALEHEEEEEAMLASAVPQRLTDRLSSRGAGGRGAKAKQLRPVEKGDALFAHLSTARTASFEAATSALTTLTDTLDDLLPASLAPLHWIQWLGNTQKPLLEVAEGWVRRQRAGKVMMWTEKHRIEEGREGGLLSSALMPSAMRVGWRPCPKRRRGEDEHDRTDSAEDEEENEGGDERDLGHDGVERASGEDREQASEAGALKMQTESTAHRIDADDSVEEDLTPSELSDEERALGQEDDVRNADSGVVSAGALAEVSSPRLDSVQRLFEHPTLTLELLIVLCENILQELLPEHHDDDNGTSNGAHVTTGHHTFAQHIHRHTAAQLASGATAPESLTAAVTCLTSAASGALPLLSPHSESAVLQWLFSWLALSAPGTSHRTTGRAGAPHHAPPSPAPVLPYLTAALSGPGQSVADLSFAAPTRRQRRGRTSAGDTTTSLPSAWQRLSTRSPHGLRLLLAPLSMRPRAAPARLHTQWEEALQRLLSHTAAEDAVVPPSSPLPVTAMAPVALLPPDMYDLLDEGRIVALDYLTREAFVILFFIYQQQSDAPHSTVGGGTVARSVGDLLEDVASSLGTRAAAALDRDAFRAAIHELARWQLLQLSATGRQAHSDGHAAAIAAHRGGSAAGHRDGELVTLCGSKGRLEEFLRMVLGKHADWCEGVLGLGAKDYIHMRNLV